jgi:hypothetical protein
MTLRKFNWQIWAGFLLSIFAFVSFFLIFVNFPTTRDFPWANLLLFGVAIVLIIFGVGRAFAPDRPRPALSKIVGSALAILSVMILGLFIFSVFVFATWLPASSGAPQIGHKAPEFSLTDSAGKTVTLADLIATPISGKAPKGVLLIFYRGYW